MSRVHCAFGDPRAHGLGAGRAEQLEEAEHGQGKLRISRSSSSWMVAETFTRRTLVFPPGDLTKSCRISRVVSSSTAFRFRERVIIIIVGRWHETNRSSGVSWA